jgi:hypothetical protein
MNSFKQYLKEKTLDKSPVELLFSKEMWLPIMRDRIEKIFKQNLLSLLEKIPNFVDKNNKNIIWLNAGHGTERGGERLLPVKVLAQAFHKAKNIFFGEYEKKLLSNELYKKHLKAVNEVKPNNEYKIFSFIQKENDPTLLSDIMKDYVLFSQKFMESNRHIFDQILKQD